MILRIVDLPEPLAPRMILVCPEISVKLMFLQHDLLVEREPHLVEHHDRRAALVEDLLRRLGRLCVHVVRRLR